MRRNPFYSLYGAALLAAMSWAQWRGLTFGSLDQGRTAPRSVRDNPGASRPTYGGYPRYSGGK